MYRILFYIKFAEKISIITYQSFRGLIMQDNSLSFLESKSRAIEQIIGISKDYYSSLTDACRKIATFRNDLLQKPVVIDLLKESNPLEITDLKQKLDFCFCVDALKCFHGMGLNITLWSKEFYCLSFFTAHLAAESFTLPFEAIVDYEKMLSDQLDFCLSLDSQSSIFCEASQLATPLVLPDDDTIQQYLILLYRWASLVAKVDTVITDQEQEWLSSLMNLDKWVRRKGPADSKTYCNETETALTPIEELHELVGLSSVKKEIESLYNYVRVQKQREEMGLRVSDISYHCVFTGNAGTGKTTVARIVSRIYKELGILKKGTLVETDRSGLVAEYVGQTAIKTNKIIDSALDGVLFIDEAYALAEGGDGDFGKEAIATLVKRMEDDRNRLVVILAGYSADIKRFIETNVGLKSRFNRYINFPDYTVDELYDIFLSIAKKYDYSITEEGLITLKNVLANALNDKDAYFGNARFVRNLFEKSIENQANRLASMSKVTPELLSMITEKDIAVI